MSTPGHDIELLRGQLLSEDGIVVLRAIDALHVSMGLAAAVGRVPDGPVLAESARTVTKFVRKALAVASGPGAGPLNWLGPEGEASLDALGFRGRAAEVLALNAVLLASGMPDPEQAVADFGRLAFGVDPLSVFLGDLVSRRPLEVDPPRLPPDLTELDELYRRTCLLGVQHAASQFGQVASEHPRPLPGSSITGVDPAAGCTGDNVTIHGSGFGSTQPGNVTVMFTRRDGGCVAATATSWSNTEIVVTVPDGVGHGCVGLTLSTSGFAEIASAAEQFAGELESCLGPMATLAAQKIRQSGIQVLAAACPECTNPAARFRGGPPLITSFLVNRAQVADIAPGDSVTLSWTIQGADQAAIVPLAGVLPQVTNPVDPETGSFTLPIGSPDGTVGSWRLTASNRCGSSQSTVQVVVKGRQALVLSGGGAKGAFEVGAVRCLRDVPGVKFDIISGASVGALNATKLAEGGMALADLENLWLGMQGDSDLYLERAWFTSLEPILKSLLRAGSSSLAFEAAGVVASYAANKIIGSFLSALGIPGVLYSVFTSAYPVITGAIDLVKYYNAIQQAMKADSVFIFTPVAQKVDASIDPALVAASGIKLRLTTVALESGKARVVTEKGVMLDSGFQVPLREAVKASASIPIAFSPVPLSGPNGTEHYVDGGVRENVPLRAAVEAGAHRLYAVLLNPANLDFVTGFSTPTMVKIAGRSVDLVLHEAQANDIEPFGGFGVPVTIIAPTFLVHDTLLVDPGLISINMHYGYMRAYDDVVATPASRSTLRQLSDEITAMRVEAWNLEHWANGERLPGAIKGVLVPVPDPVAMQQARTVKKDIRSKVYQRIAASAANSTPPGRAAWWQGWERHPWSPLMNTPWDAFASKLGTLPAEAMPPS
jgi:predicted acylesterase/phospholipase RssA